VLLGQPRLGEDERAQGLAQRLNLRALGQPTDVKDEGLGERAGEGGEDGEGRHAAGREGVGGAWVGQTQQGFLCFAYVSVGYMEGKSSGEGRDDREAYEEVASVALEHGRIAYHAVYDKLQNSSNLVVGWREQNIYIADKQPL